MYFPNQGLTLGFHGCDSTVVEKVISKTENLNHSTAAHEWLGDGIYFWEYSQMRAFEYAEELKLKPRKNGPLIVTPAVLGAVLDLKNCLDLTTREGLDLLKTGYQILYESYKILGKEMPKNLGTDPAGISLRRVLDCAVINNLNKELKAFDSIRGVFWEGDELYPGAGFREKNHIQICVRNQNCILGYFHPRDEV
ncbi:hypothetical protein GVN16_01550 [Emticicia sp. CRIBPO]|uniref:hypothetical protein n=1 Tax=Emticicia sp. CRIBPO TaxID=2683258 RepID=UPI00141201CA|nr:hypothetical protein [Emticicia sp. CRIBPO]NBA84424.1 hypothetical protein [Emticicia sp. CRIBPO]